MGGYPGAAGPGPVLNGAEYAQVIRDANTAAPAQPARPEGGLRDRYQGQPRKHDESSVPPGQSESPGQSRAAAGPAPSAPGSRAITAGALPDAGPADSGQAVLAYGPDDPGYGPPPAEWYRLATEREQAGRAEAVAEPQGGRAEPSGERDPFEPIKRSDRAAGHGSAHAPSQVLSGYVPPSREGSDGHDGTEQPDDTPADLDFDLDLSGLGGNPVGQLHGLYAVAEGIPGGASGKQLDQLLEKQRKLISEYFKESAGQVPGFDSAASLADLRGTLRGAP